MRAKDYMNQVAIIDTMISNKLVEVERWRNIATGTSAQSEDERVQASGSMQKMADAVCWYVQLESELESDIRELVDKRQEIISTIQQLPVVEYDVLHKRYIQGLKLYEIASITGKSYSWVSTMHGRGLANVQKILNSKKGGGE